MDMDPNLSLWKKDQPAKNQALDRDITADVAVIGGGLTGLSSAYHLKKKFPQKHIVVLEARGVGHGASGRNGGMLLTAPISEYMTVSSADLHKDLYDIGADNIERITALMQAQGLADGIRRNGALSVNATSQKVAHSQKYVAKARDFGLPLEFWSREQVAEALGTNVYWGGVYDPRAGEVNPMKLVGAFKEMAESAGAVIYEDSPVISIQTGSSHHLKVSGVGQAVHQVTVAAVVLAANGYTAHLGLLKHKVLAVHTELAATTPLDDAVFEKIGWKSRITFHDDRHLLFYLGSMEGNRITIGGGHSEYYFNNGVSYKKDVNARCRPLMDELLRIYPQLQGVRFEKIWSGVMGMSLSFLESIGVTGPHHNIYYGFGYAGHGVNMATLAGRVIADLYAGEGERWERCPYVHRKLPNLPPEPFKWLGFNTMIKQRQVQDRMDAR